MKPQKAKSSKISTPSGSKKNNEPSVFQSRKRLVVLSLDLSLTATGLVVYDGKRALWRLLQTEPLNKEGQSQGLLPSGIYRGLLEDRIEWQRLRIANAFRKFLPDLMVIEEYSFGSKGRGLSSIHELGGVIKNHLHRKQAVWLTVQNAIIKQWATGKGNASKEQMIAAAVEAWPQFPKTLGKKADNIADAYHIATWAHFHIDLLTQNVSSAKVNP